MRKTYTVTGRAWTTPAPGSYRRHLIEVVLDVLAYSESHADASWMRLCDLLLGLDPLFVSEVS